jgi:ketosteroid isomerase-like protein
MSRDDSQGHAALAARVATLESRLATLEAAESIRNLKSRYAELVDRRYRRGGGVVDRSELEPIADAIAALFSEDAVWDGGPSLGLCEGRAAIRERFLDPTLLFSWHYFLKPRITVTGDTAEARWDLLSPCTTRDGRPHWLAGVEHDAYRREEGRWLHTRMRLDVVFMAPHERGWLR